MWVFFICVGQVHSRRPSHPKTPSSTRSEANIDDVTGKRTSTDLDGGARNFGVDGGGGSQGRAIESRADADPTSPLAMFVQGAMYHVPCIVYSFGSNGDFSFELELNARLPQCQVRTPPPLPAFSPFFS